LWFAIVEDEQKFLTAVTFIADEMGVLISERQSSFRVNDR